MITYVVDNNIFSRSFKNLSMDVFDDIWEPWSQYMALGRIISVDEVYRELNVWVSNNDKDSISKWLKTRKSCFIKPTNEEGFILQSIFRYKKFRDGVKEKSLRQGSPEADAFLVAKAKYIGGIVVTAEKDDKPNSEKIPNIAVATGVPYMKIDDFYKMLRNVHWGRPEYADVIIYRQLGIPNPLLL
ncbi:MAG: DUF4411 family protein [Bacteroides graminisolvens]|nr:DUF4411 family protein [Bacteroides graminisolvens]